MLDLTGCFDGGAGKPLYEQLYEHLAEQIRRGRLVRGEKLPGKRTLAQQLAVAVNTVDAAYQMLVAEGYLEARPKSGFYVLDYAGGPARPAAPVPEEDPGEDGEGEAPAFDLATGAVDTDLFPFRTWGRIQKELLYARPELLSHGHRQGDEDLRRALADYLGAYRGVVCAPGQIVVGAGVEYLLGLVAQLLRGGTAAIENPGYARSRTILENSGVPCRCVDIDEGGLPAAGLEESGANLCYVTPSHHFPTAVTMPAGRRAQLLAWAARAPGRYILEDDYDAEFRFDMRPLPSLRAWRGPTARWCISAPSPRAWPPASALPAWSCPGTCWSGTGPPSAPTPTPSAALSSRPSAAFWRRGTSPGTCPGCAAPIRAGWRPWSGPWRRTSAEGPSGWRAATTASTCC